jgi:hypothetical protein
MQDEDLRVYCLFGHHFELELPFMFGGRGIVPAEHISEWNSIVENMHEGPSGELRFRLAASTWEFQRTFCPPEERGASYLRVRARTTEAAVLAAHAVRARRHGVPCTLRRWEWRAMVRAFGGNCAYCGRRALTVDHVVPLSRGGAHAIENVVPACHGCNMSKGVTGVDVWLARQGSAVHKVLDRIARHRAEALFGLMPR